MFGRGLGDTYAVFLLPLEREFGWARSQLTGVYSVYLLVNGFTAPLVGLAFDRLGPRWVFGAGVACLGAAFFLAGGIVSLWQFYVLIGALVGIAVSLNGMVPGSALLARWYRARLHRHRHRILRGGRRHAGLRAARSIPRQRIPLARGLSHLRAHAPCGCTGGAFLLPWRRFAAGHPEYQPKLMKGEGGWTLRAAMRTPVYWGLALIFFCTATAMFSVIVQLVAFLVDTGFSPFTAASAFGALGMLSALSIMASGFLSDRFGYRQAVTASFLGTASGMAILLVLTQFPSHALLIAFVAIFGLCMGTRGPVVSSVCAKVFAGANVATIYGTIYSMNALGAAFGSYVGGVLHDLTGGYRGGLVFALVFIAIAATPFWAIRPLRTFR